MHNICAVLYVYSEEFLLSMDCTLDERTKETSTIAKGYAYSRKRIMTKYQNLPFVNHFLFDRFTAALAKTDDIALPPGQKLPKSVATVGSLVWLTMLWTLYPCWLPYGLLRGSSVARLSEIVDDYCAFLGAR